MVAGSPGTILRNMATINTFKSLPKSPQGPHPLLKHFYNLLESGVLNETESIELCRLVLQQNKPQMISNWVA